MVKKIFPGDEIGDTECDGCGASVKLKVNKNHMVYWYCTNIVRPNEKGHGKYCYSKHTFGKWASQEIINELEKSDEVEKHGEIEQSTIKKERDRNLDTGTGDNAGDDSDTGNAGDGTDSDTGRKRVFLDIIGTGSLFD